MVLTVRSVEHLRVHGGYEQRRRREHGNDRWRTDERRHAAERSCVPGLRSGTTILQTIVNRTVNYNVLDLGRGGGEAVLLWVRIAKGTHGDGGGRM